MRTHHHKGAQGTLQQQPKHTFQPYNNQFYFLEVYPTTLCKCIYVYVYKSLYHQICLKDIFPPLTTSDVFLSFSYRYNKSVEGTL